MNLAHTGQRGQAPLYLMQIDALATQFDLAVATAQKL
jgi:hypothetical protein